MSHLRVITGRYTSSSARLSRQGVKYKGKLYRPIAVRGFQAIEANSGSVVGGAIAGAVIAGGVGALVGALAGGKRGMTNFQLLLADGPTLMCECKTSDYPGLVVTIQALIDGQAIPFQWGRLIWAAVIVLFFAATVVLQIAFAPPASETASATATVTRSVLAAALACGGRVEGSSLLLAEKLVRCPWPFSVAEVKIECQGSAAAPMVLVVANDKIYGLNGLSQGRYPSITPIWRDDKKLASQGMTGMKIDVGPYIAAGRALCS